MPTWYNKQQADTLLATKATPAQITAAVAAITKTTLGLGNVDNTADANKPVSAAQQAAITTAVNGILNGAPGALDTLKELADAIGDDANYAASITTALAAKATPAQITSAIAAQATSDRATYVTFDGTNVLLNGNVISIAGAGLSATDNGLGGITTSSSAATDNGLGGIAA